MHAKGNIEAALLENTALRTAADRAIHRRGRIHEVRRFGENDSASESELPS